MASSKILSMDYEEYRRDLSDSHQSGIEKTKYDVGAIMGLTKGQRHGEEMWSAECLRDPVETLNRIFEHLMDGVAY